MDNLMLFHNYFGDKGWSKYAVYSPDKKFILIIADNNYVILWNVNKRKLVWEYDFFQYLQEITDDENTFIQSAIFSSDGRYITFSAFNRDPFQNYILKIETLTRNIIKPQTANHDPPIEKMVGG